MTIEDEIRIQVLESRRKRIVELEDALIEMIRAYDATNDSAPHRIAAYLRAKALLSN